MVNQQNNPKMDFGFHAMIPRLIRTDYKNLTAVQKWLYVCLKDLCGNHGTCYRSLRVLAEETGISTGMLSESIPVLHAAGLIHAEKKKRATGGGKEVWHITIVDIWIANGKAHPTKRSQNEQTLEEQEKNVHTVNNNVHRMNKLTGERSQNEQECSLCETEVIEDKQEENKARKDKQDSVIVATAHADVNAPTTFFVHPLHSFLSFDDLMAPTTMIISLTSKQFESEMEDDHRYRIAGEIEHELAVKGLQVKVQTVHDKDDTVVAANSTPVPSEKTQEVPVEQPKEKKPRAPRKSRARTYPIPADLKVRVDNVYAFLNKWRQDITGDPAEKFDRNYEADEAVCSLFQGKPPTEKNLRQLCEKMWNEPANPRTGYYEREHMTIKRICARYKSESLAMAVKEKPSTKQTLSIVANSSSPALQRYVPSASEKNPDELEQWINPKKQQPRRGQRAQGGR